MNKELFVTATPHETKVGITEDDQLAEIYLERENEYTLAGSIYKGRVTRVLPGMQSAFVDIGLERDAFLYVSDFMDLEQQDEDLDEAIPANRPVNDGQPRRAVENGTNGQAQSTESGDVTDEGGSFQEAATETSSTAGPARDSREFRGRRRRRGRRGDNGRGENGRGPAVDRPERSESRPAEEPRSERPARVEPRGFTPRFQRPAPPAARPGRDYDYGPPPGYQPIILPGESISKYQRQATSAAPTQTESEHELPTAIASSFPEDEPIFAAETSEVAVEQPETHEATELHDEMAASVQAPQEVGELRGDAVSVVEVENETEENELAHEADFAAALGRADEPASEVAVEEPVRDVHYNATGGHVEEQEIEDEEAELGAYGDDLEDEDGFEVLEEETRGAGGELLSEGVLTTTGSEPHAAEGAEPVEALAQEVDEQEEEELELEEAQAEAEALLEAEAIGDGTVDASAEVRGPAPEAGLLQRTQRRGFERSNDPERRRGGRRGGGGSGRRRFRSRENQVVPQISDLLKEGQEILVQIAKEPIGKKGARITSHIALPGRFLVFMPTVNHTGVSRKISSEEERQRLKRIIQSERENGGGGFIVRTAAAGASDEELRADIRFLKNLWSEIKSRSDSGSCPALIYHDLNVVERVLRDQVTSDFSVIWVDAETEYERILRFANRFQPALVKRVKLYTKETPLFEQFGLNEEINKALKSKVWLKSGGYIVINQTEALVAIDVNTGKYVGKTTRLEDTIVKTNVDAIREIVRQIRLRDLGGIIIIDFIDMDERRNRQKVMQALEEALRADRAPSKVLQFNDFGLVAITRKRVKQSLERTIGSPCPYCQSTGFVKAVNTICNEIYVEMRKIAPHLEHSDVMLRVNPEVAKALKVGNAKLLNEMEEVTKRAIIVKSDPALHQEQFDIH
jgi:Rne/Rng family ribonuclease